MNCPDCNLEMEMGYIQSGRGMIWSKRKHKLSFWPKTKDGDIQLGEVDIFGIYKEAYHCPQCGTILIPHADK